MSLNTHQFNEVWNKFVVKDDNFDKPVVILVHRDKLYGSFLPCAIIKIGKKVQPVRLFWSVRLLECSE